MSGFGSRIVGEVLSSSIRLASSLSFTRRYMPAGLNPHVDIRRRLPGKRFHTVFDVGAHRGQWTSRSLQYYPKADIYSFEPVTGTYEHLTRVVGKRPNVHCRKLALGPTPGLVEIVLQRESSTNSLRHVTDPSSTASDRAATEKVEVVTLDGFCESEGIAHIDFLKVDAEGYDLEVLRSGERLLGDNQVDFIQVETGILSTDAALVPLQDTISFLAQRDFALFGLYHQTPEWRGRVRLLFCDAVFVSNRLADSPNRDDQLTSSGT